MAKPYTKFEVCSFSRSEDISWGNWSRDPDHATFRDCTVVWRLTLDIAYSYQKDNDHAGDEEFRRCRSSHLEQSISRPANRNSFSSDVRSTSNDW